MRRFDVHLKAEKNCQFNLAYGAELKLAH